MRLFCLETWPVLASLRMYGSLPDPFRMAHLMGRIVPIEGAGNNEPWIQAGKIFNCRWKPPTTRLPWLIATVDWQHRCLPIHSLSSGIVLLSRRNRGNNVRVPRRDGQKVQA